MKRFEKIVAILLIVIAVSTVYLAYNGWNTEQKATAYEIARNASINAYVNQTTAQNNCFTDCSNVGAINGQMKNNVCYCWDLNSNSWVSYEKLSSQIPTLNKYVNDFANVLSTYDIDRINTLCAEIEKNTTAEIAVLTVNTTQPMTIEEYAVDVFQNNGIGKKDTNNGLLIVAAIQDRKWRFEVGKGLTSTLNDSETGSIGETYLNPAFIEGMYGDGLYNAIEAIYVNV